MLYILEISSRNTSPRAWRRLGIDRKATFSDLHLAIQAACGWKNRHLFQFKDLENHVLAGIPDGPDDLENPEASINRIDEVFGDTIGTRIIYIYDFGYRWEHDVQVVGLEEREADTVWGILPSGEHAFPPEDY